MSVVFYMCLSIKQCSVKPVLLELPREAVKDCSYWSYPKS